MTKRNRLALGCAVLGSYLVGIGTGDIVISCASNSVPCAPGCEIIGDSDPDGGPLYRVVPACCRAEQFTIGPGGFNTCYPRQDGGC